MSYLMLFIIFISLWMFFAWIHGRLLRVTIQQHVSRMVAEVVVTSRFFPTNQQLGGNNHQRCASNAYLALCTYYYMVTYQTADAKQVVRICCVNLLGGFAWLDS